MSGLGFGALRIVAMFWGHFGYDYTVYIYACFFLFISFICCSFFIFFFGGGWWLGVSVGRFLEGLL